MKENKKGNFSFFVKVGILILVILFSGWKVFSEFKEYRDSKILYDEVANKAVTNNKINLEIPSEKETSQSEVISDNEEIFIDFEYLQSENPDVVGWIRRDDEKINYPVVKGKDNDFYLYRSMDGTKNKCGSIFMDYSNDPGFKDDITLIYGHNMKDGSMFASLKDYESSENIPNIPRLRVYTPEGSKNIEIKYVFFHSGYNELYTNFKDDEDCNEYINSLEDSAIYKSGEALKREDRLIALVTCEYVFENARLVVLGKLED